MSYSIRVYYMTLADDSHKILTKNRVVTIEELCSETGRAGITVKQALAKLDYLTSYDHNSRFYALRSVCRFNQHGIWKHERASFTSHRTLAALLVALVDKARAGCTSGELEIITGIPVTGVLHSLTIKDQLVRVRWRGEYVYFTAKSKRRRGGQARARCGSSKPLAHHEERKVTTEELKKTIVVLLEIIRSCPNTITALREQIRRTHPEIPGSMVNQICRTYGIRLKKKINRHQIFEIAVKLAKALEGQTGKPYVFHFAPDRRYCPTCGELTEYFKTTNDRTVSTIRYGDVTFRESQVICTVHRYRPDDDAPLIYGSSFARSLAPSKSPIGFDVITEIGKRRFLDYRQVEEVVDDLQGHGIRVSTSTVSRWGDYFLASVECLHYTKIQKLWHLIRQNGGYLLHIDATTETKSDTVFVCVDRILGAVLLSEKISSENKEEVKEQLYRLKRQLGNPRAIMRDMSHQLKNAVEEVFPDVPDRICQSHFLRDIGKDLLEREYVQLGHRMVGLKINADLNKMKRDLQRQIPVEKVEKATALFKHVSLIEDVPSSVVRNHEDVLALRLVIDVLAYKRDAEGLGFPFDLYRVLYVARLNRLRLRLERYRQRHPRVMSQCANLQRLSKIAHQVTDDALRQHVRTLRSTHRCFGELRSVLRFVVKNQAPLAATMSIGGISEIRAYNRALVSYTKRLLRAKKRGNISNPEKVILKHLVDYQFKLPIPEQLAELLEKLDRTNNFEEGIFRECKRGQRRQVGKKDISREFSLHGPYLPLMINLRNDHYVAAMIGDIADLPIRISELDPREIDHYRKKLKENRRGKFFEYLKDIDGIDMLPGYLA
jgi:transposase-like protein